MNELTAAPNFDQKKRQGAKIGSIASFAAILFLTSLVFEAPFRLALDSAGLPALIYLPKLVLFLTIPLLLSSGRRLTRRSTLAFILIAIAFIYGVLSIGSVNQVTFGLWILTPLAFGMIVSQDVLGNAQRFRTPILFLFFSATTGIFLDTSLEFPWEGMRLDLGEASVEISRQWTAFGIERYAGFSRASFSAAAQILVFGIWIVATQGRVWLKLSIWLLAGYAIFLTTSKGPAGAWAVLSIFFLSRHIPFARRFIRIAWKIIAWAIATVAILAPVSTFFIDYDSKIENFTDAVLFASFGDRLTWMWPDSFSLIHAPLEWIFGRSIGGIGAAQMYFEPANYLPGDNIFVYLTVTAGVPLAIMLLILLTRRAIAALADPAQGNLVYSLTVFILLYGIVVNIIEDPLLALILGMVISTPRSGTIFASR
ncbi:hypothetical protein [Stenotrophomonas hibiscicola]|uniref:hypothetical protein n=1 Tax=Stenotrophomonas hibiscicola TaxID=86189 RepID=UPI001313D053|nr:hypothetical protein [[Pseudomonas] hibiscicola]